MTLGNMREQGRASSRRLSVGRQPAHLVYDLACSLLVNLDGLRRTTKAAISWDLRGLKTMVNGRCLVHVRAIRHVAKYDHISIAQNSFDFF